MEDFVVHVALPSLLTVSNEGEHLKCFKVSLLFLHTINYVIYNVLYAFIGHGAADTDPEAEASARLTCHLLLRLFKTTEVPQPSLYSVG